MPTVKPAKDLADWVVLSPQEVWVVQHMAMAPSVPQVTGESEVLEDMAHCTAAAVAVAVTTVAAAAEPMLTHAAPMPEAVVEDLHTPIQV